MDDRDWLFCPFISKKSSAGHGNISSDGRFIAIRAYQPDFIGIILNSRDEIVVEGTNVGQDKVEQVICRHLGIAEPDLEKKGILGRIFGK